MLATVHPIQDVDALAAKGGGHVLPDPLGSIAKDDHPPQDGLGRQARAASSSRV
jgi:hypothetical protein